MSVTFQCRNCGKPYRGRSKAKRPSWPSNANAYASFMPLMTMAPPATATEWEMATQDANCGFPGRNPGEWLVSARQGGQRYSFDQLSSGDAAKLALEMGHTKQDLIFRHTVLIELASPIPDEREFMIERPDGRQQVWQPNGQEPRP